jgi:hypothetical protein
MSHKKSGGDARAVTLLKSAEGNDSARIEAEELLDEIDNLALLLHEVKQQTDRIEAAADAIGDAILCRVGPERATQPVSRAAKRPVSIPAKTSARVQEITGSRP